MVATYPDLLTNGITDLGRFDQFDLFAGESKIVTDQGQAPDGVAIVQFQVLALDANGRYAPFVALTDYATGSISFSGRAIADETVTVNGHAITWKASGAVADQVNLGADTQGDITNLAALINAHPETYAVHADVGTGVLNLTAIAQGSAGNAIALAEAGTNTSVSGGTLTDVAADNVDIGNEVVGIAAQAVPAATPGAYFPMFVGGVFNHEALVWPAGIATLAQRKAVMSGTMLGVRQLL